MTHATALADLQLARPSLVTIGVFDGVHRGHQLLIRHLVAEAKARDQQAVAITFFPHPDLFLKGVAGRYYLTTPDERARLLHDLGVDHVITLTFDEALRQVRAADFVAALVRQLRLASLWVGSDFALGYKREGTVDFLRAQGVAHGFTVHAIDLLVGGAGTISSTAIREALSVGDVTKAAADLGRAYQLSGEVVHGQQRGRTIGFPTANIAAWEQQVIPANGVYAGWATLNGSERFMAVTNVGQRPTFDMQDITVEAYLLDFDRDIYGQTLSFSFEQRLRGEQKFPGLDALVAQITADAAAARAYLSSVLRSR